MEDQSPHSAETGVTLDPLASVIRYHEETKHQFFRYARSLGYLDWANQPDPFRRFEGAPLIPLPMLEPTEDPLSPAYVDLYRAGAIPAQPVTLRTLSRFLEFALALSAWKQVGDVRWALRTNPSSGNLHPTEGYLLLGPCPELARTPALYHYAPKEHGLERRADCPQEVFTHLSHAFPSQAFFMGLTSVLWREAWKYGERAFRYCQHDVGHAIGAARIAAASLGWKLVLLEGLSDDQLNHLFGTNRKEDFLHAEKEHPDCLAVVWPAKEVTPQTAGGPEQIPLFFEPHILDGLSQATWYGRANRLSRDTPVPWEIIDEVALASLKKSREHRFLDVSRTGSGVERGTLAEAETPSVHDGAPSAGHIIRQRRSAVAFDGKTSVSLASFITMMARVIPCAERPVRQRPMPWDAITWEPGIHLLLFVHRVDGLSSGLYCLVRNPTKVDALKEAMHRDFCWERVTACPADLPLYFLQEGDARKVAAQVSCHQDIAGDSAFSLGMLAEFDSPLREHGPWYYRRLFWEAGIVGQVLYLEAEAAGVRATGIGCFFDDPVHQVFGIKDMAFQSLYHFTTGGPVDDPRLTTLPPYGHIRSGGRRA